MAELTIEEQRREMAAFSQWAWRKEGEPIGRMLGQVAAREAWLARAAQAKDAALGVTACRVLDASDPFCPKCGHNRDRSSVSSVDQGDGRHSCQKCGAEWVQPAAGVMACHCADRLAGRVDGNVHFEGCPHFVPPDDALRRALGDIISQTVVAERMGYTDPQDWQEKFQRVRQIARNALGVKENDRG